MRHSTAHVMAAAVCRLYSDVKLDIGPAIEDGFYYDFDLPKRLSPEDFPEIEKEMARIVALNLPFERLVVSRDEVTAILKKSNQTYKLERLADIPEGAEITLYRCGDFVDLCRGPHLATTGEIKSFKLVSVAGSYYRGVERNPMLQRLYGIAAASDKELKAIADRVEEAKKRDHRKLGRELDLFSVSEEVGPGLILWHPKGARIRAIIEEFWRQQHFKGGYELMYTPHIGRANLWETSGHLGFYRENMYSPMEIDENEYFVKPMNCPFHIQIYKTHKHSYRDLPLRWAELGTVYRYEKSGVLNGLFRVRGFTQDDAHIFCTPEQIENEIRETVRFALKMLRGFGFTEFTAYLSTKPAKAVGEDARWEQAIKSLEGALKAEALAYQVDEGGGAFYGPKIDIKIKDALGREWQLSTIQFDFNEPERFDMTYVGEDGNEHRPYMVHRALLGSLERFFGILIEHYSGAFPLWMAPEQVRVLPITDDQMAYAQTIVSKLTDAGFRAVVDKKSEKIGAKIRRAQVEKIPYMAIVGAKEVESGKISLRTRSEGDKGAVAFDDLVELLRKESVPTGFGIAVSDIEQKA
jgi:threonyl-tRNA synthetase